MGSPTPRRAAPFFEIASQAPTSAEGEQQLHIRRPTAHPRRCAERPRLGPQRKASYVPITHNGEKRATLQYHTTAKSELRSNITQRRKGYAPTSAEGEPQLHMTAEGRPSPVRGAPEQKASYAPKTIHTHPRRIHGSESLLGLVGLGLEAGVVPAGAV